MNLRDKLFSDSNITGYTDRNNQPILVGQQIIDEVGNIVFVVSHHGKYCVANDFIEYNCSLGGWILNSEWVEIVVPASEQNVAPVAIAPFDKEHNLARNIPNRPIKKGKRRY